MRFLASPVNEALKSVIRTFQAEVQRALALFKEYRHLDDILAWRKHGLSRTGYLDPKHQHDYSFHGIGCRVGFSPELQIDWDFGHDGRMDGFDLWRLQHFLEERPELQRVLPLAALKDSFEDEVRNGVIVSPWRAEHDNLYYLAEDLSVHERTTR